MNLKEYIQSEIKSVLTEDYDLDQAFNDAEPVEEGVMSELDILAKEAKDLKSFVKTVFKEFDNLPKNKETLKWLEGIYKDSKNESVNEEIDGLKNAKDLLKYPHTIDDIEYRKTSRGDKFVKIIYKKTYVPGKMMDTGPHFVQVFYTDEKDLQNIGKALKLKLKESVNEGKMPKKYIGRDDIVYLKTKEDSKGANYNLYYKGHSIEFGDRRFGSEKELKDFAKDYILSNQWYNKLKYADAKPLPEASEQLDEKLITFSNRAPYGQIVFMAGGAGSGKGFAIDNFIDAAGFKVRDVDEMKKAVAKLDQLGKFSVDKWYKKYGNKLSNKPNKNGGLSPKEHIEEFMLGKGLSISDIANPKHQLGGLKNPNNVASLHYIVDSMGLKDKWVVSMLSGKNNKETLPNLLFDITAKNVASITDVIKQLEPAGYDSKNIHLIWVLTNFHVAIKANKERDRVVPDDILLQTHEGASTTMWEVMTKILPKGLDGRIDVILNNRSETIPYKDKDGNTIKVEPNQQNKLKDAEIVVKGFTSLPIKKQGGGVQPETAWKEILKKWILNNAPKTIDLTQKVDK